MKIALAAAAIALACGALALVVALRREPADASALDAELARHEELTRSVEQLRLAVGALEQRLAALEAAPSAGAVRLRQPAALEGDRADAPAQVAVAEIDAAVREHLERAEAARLTSKAKLDARFYIANRTDIPADRESELTATLADLHRELQRLHDRWGERPQVLAHERDEYARARSDLMRAFAPRLTAACGGRAGFDVYTAIVSSTFSGEFTGSLHEWQEAGGSR